MSDIMPNGNSPTATWTDKDYTIFEEWIRGVLHTSRTEITFTKKDGTERVMRCTLDPNLMPPPRLDPLATAIVESEAKKPKKFVIRAYDTEKQGWRSFDVHSVRSIRFFLGEPEEETDPNWPFPTGKKP